MRCRDAKLWLNAQRDGDLAQSEVSTLQEHLKHCSVCRTFARRQQRLDTFFSCPTTRTHTTISTERIMLAVQQQRRITQQLEDLRTQQQSRIAQLKTVGPSVAALAFFSLGILPALLIALLMLQPNLIEQSLMLLSNMIDVLIVFGQYLQAGMMLVTRDNWILLGVALVLVLMMGMWLRLMRYPKEA